MHLFPSCPEKDAAALKKEGEREIETEALHSSNN